MTSPLSDYESIEVKIEDDSPPKVLPNTYWVTRGKTAGQLDATCQVWAVRPEMVPCDDGDLFWIAPLSVVDTQVTLLGEWTLGEAALHIFNAVPGTERECVRVGPEPVVVAEKLVS